MTPAELMNELNIAIARIGAMFETLKRIESQGSTTVVLLTNQDRLLAEYNRTIRSLNRQNSAMRKRLAKAQSTADTLLAQQTVRSELTSMLREFLQPQPDQPQLPAKPKPRRK